MDSDEVLTTDFGIAKLMNVGDFRTRDRACRTFAAGVVTQAFFRIVSKNRFPHQALVNANYSMRAVVVVNGSLLTGPPADHEHLNRLIATNSMAPVVAFLESDVGLQIEKRNFHV